MDELAQALANADPEMLRQAMEAGILDEKQALLADQMARAQALRGSKMPQGRMIGDVYVAPNMGENIGAALQQFAGWRDQNRIQGEQMDVLDQRIRDRLAGLHTMAGVPFGYGGQ